MLIVFFLLALPNTNSVAASRVKNPSDYYDTYFNDNMVKSKRNELPNCDEDKLLEMLKSIQIVNPEQIVNLATENAPTLCEKLEKNVKIMDEYLQTCKPATQEDLYLHLIKGVQQLFNTVCEDGRLKSKYKEVFECVAKQDFSSCKGPPDWNENSNKQKVCKAYSEILDCYKEKAITTCQKETGSIFADVVKEVISSVVPDHCPEIGSGIFNESNQTNIEKNSKSNEIGGGIKESDDDLPPNDDEDETTFFPRKNPKSESSFENGSYNINSLPYEWLILLFVFVIFVW